MNEPAPARPRETVKETLISIVIALVLAFVFRGFVVEAFVIPTGSMAPTLLGAHMRFRGSQSGNSWAVGPWSVYPNTTDATPIQTGPNGGPVVVHDPMTGERIEQLQVGRRAGDRILILKYLYAIQEPARYDVVVFKNPTDPQVNYIKRLVGLPGEQVALVDGDVFVRPGTGGEPGPDTWDEPGWRLAAKPPAVQEAVWQPVFSSEYTPLRPTIDERRWFRAPWAGIGAGWDTEGRVYRYTGAGPTTLLWDAQAGRAPNGTWAIGDSYAYNERSPAMAAADQPIPVGDLRLRAAVEPAGPGLVVSATVIARGHEFQGLIEGTTGTLRMRALPGDGGGTREWQTLAAAPVPALEPGRASAIEFWHADQTLRLRVNGRDVVTASYPWGPGERILHATGRSVARVLEEGHGDANPFARARLYRASGARWDLSGPATMSRVGLDRDLAYRAAAKVGNIPALATHPSRTLTVEADQFFCCGDNSPQSLDGRLWGEPAPWAARLMAESGMTRTEGVVPRDLLLGKAFFVYFPSLLPGRPMPVPDMGRLRFIR